MPAALAIFLRHPDDFGEAICEAVWHGGLGGGVPAMAGTLAGARLGMGGIPGGWCDRLGGAERILATADLLFELWELRAG